MHMKNLEMIIIWLLIALLIIVLGVQAVQFAGLQQGTVLNPQAIKAVVPTAGCGV